MSEPTNAEINAAVAERVMGLKMLNSTTYLGPGYNYAPFSPTESDADAMAVLRRCCEIENDALLQLHNMMMKEKDGKLTPLLVCKLALQLFP